jgi:hypothetical protein
MIRCLGEPQQEYELISLFMIFSFHFQIRRPGKDHGCAGGMLSALSEYLSRVGDSAPSSIFLL